MWEDSPGWVSGRPEQRAGDMLGLPPHLRSWEGEGKGSGASGSWRSPWEPLLRLSENSHLDTFTRTARAAASEMLFG